MDTTECLGLPYPECDPPFTKDASDIIQFKMLADATDAAVQEFDDQLTATLTAPPAACIIGGVNIAGNLVNQFYGGVEFDNAGLHDPDFDGFRVQQDGFYMIGGAVRLSGLAPTVTNLRIEPILNDEEFTSRQGPAYAFTTPASEDICWSDGGFFRAGDLLYTRTLHTGNPATVCTYTSRFWILQVIVNV
jgi:hypothetical protein